MLLEFTLKTVSVGLGIIVTVGGLFLGLFELLVNSKLEDSNIRLTAIETKLDMLLEERLVEMQKSDLYRRMTESLKVAPSKK
ncbi:hypothetical protein LCGC14_2769390 [marine sediment metagenome]|uniref:Uncharacterized protein n=1 Tax=marine sediment metagenome TaxID=412755 RepID=A0A0F9BN55_9ZZZZ